MAALARTLSAERVPHGFIFCGPAGVGKALAAKALGKTLLCAKPKRGRGAHGPREACGKCEQCRLVERDSHPDLYWFRKPPERAELPIALVTRRQGSPEGPTINESVQLKPMMAESRVTIVEDAELMNEEAANAFLKTFEEAPEGAYLILVVTTLERLLPTIRSRGRLLRFAALPDEFVAKLLERDHGMSAEEAQQAARFAEGSMAQAAALARSNFVAFRGEVMTALAGLDRLKALALADAIDAWAGEQARSEAENKEAKTKVEENFLRRQYVKRALGLLAGVFRDALLVAAEGDGAKLLNADAGELIGRLARELPREKIEEAVQRFHEYQTYVDRNAHIQLLLENACLELAEFCGTTKAESRK